MERLCYYNSMSQNTLIWIAVTVGSFIGGYIPVFFGYSFLSIESLVGNTVGAVVGIIVGYKLGQNN